MDCGANMCQTRSETCSSRFWLLAGVFNWGHRQYFEYFKYQLDSTDRFWVVLDDWFAVAREKLLYPLKPTKTLPAPTCSINHMTSPCCPLRAMFNIFSAPLPLAFCLVLHCFMRPSNKQTASQATFPQMISLLPQTLNQYKMFHKHLN